MNIAIFAKNPSRARSDRHLQRVSSIIRGWQIADAIGAKLNPIEGFEHDVCIYVKPHVKPHEDFNFMQHSYLDIIDGWGLMPLIQKHPEISIITCSYVDFETVSASVENRVLLIPQHHCNFERIQTARRNILTVGCIGTSGAFRFLPPELKEGLSARGLKFLEYSAFQSRDDIVNFYKNIDIQVVWRPYMRRAKIRLSNPLKLVNAASFGVPTIALDEPAFTELKGCYFPVKNIHEFFNRLDTLRQDNNLFEEYSQRCLKKAEYYHISTIGKLYQALT